MLSLNQIPADVVVNAMLVTMVAHANQPSDIIYHISYIRYRKLPDYGFTHFTAKPWITMDGKPVKVSKVTVLNNMATFRRYMFFRYQLPLKVTSNYP